MNSEKRVDGVEKMLSSASFARNVTRPEPDVLNIVLKDGDINELKNMCCQLIDDNSNGDILYPITVYDHDDDFIIRVDFDNATVESYLLFLTGVFGLDEHQTDEIISQYDEESFSGIDDERRAALRHFYDCIEEELQAAVYNKYYVSVF